MAKSAIASPFSQALPPAGTTPRTPDVRRRAPHGARGDSRDDGRGYRRALRDRDRHLTRIAGQTPMPCRLLFPLTLKASLATTVAAVTNTTAAQAACRRARRTYAAFGGDKPPRNRRGHAAKPAYLACRPRLPVDRADHQDQLKPNSICLCPAIHRPGDKPDKAPCPTGSGDRTAARAAHVAQVGTGGGESVVD
jgi:hypothetical protein